MIWLIYTVRNACVAGLPLSGGGAAPFLQRMRDEIEEALGISPQWCAERYMVLADKAEGNGEIQNARGCLDSLSKLMGWDDFRKNNPLFPKVELIYDDLTDEDLKALYLQSDLLIAPSRAEGFGLPIAEAMKLGIPVITTAWGGQMDFCNHQNSWLIDFKLSHSSCPSS